MKERKNLYLGISGWAILLASAMSFTSCADDDIIDSSQLTTGKGICFNIANDNEAWQPDSRTSKAESTTTFHSETPDDGFSITATTTNGIRSFVNTKPQSRGTQTKEPGNDWSYKVGAYYYANANATPADFFSENTSGGLTFGSEGVGTSSYYWPQNGNISFFAVAPAIENFNVPTAENIDAPTLTYTIPSDISQQKDIMVAQTAAINTPGTSVGLNFQHLLAAVQFKVGKMQFIKINSLKVVGVRGGTISFTNNNGVWTPSLNAATTTEYDLSSLIADTSVLTTGDEITSNDNSSIMLVAPQTLPEGAKIVVNYTETITDLTYTKEATLSGEWVAGKTTTYALNISGTDFGTVEIPRPDDQDAHYIMLHMSYNMGNLSNHVSSVTATAQWLKDANGSDISGNSSTKSAISLKLVENLTETQKKGFWTDKQYQQTVTVKDNEGNKEYSEITLANNNIIGSNDLTLTNLNEGTIVLFIEENNGTQDRTGELILTATLSTGKKIIIGHSTFKQLCPSWNGTTSNSSIGVERFEDGKTHPYGFAYNRKVTYKLNWLGQLSAIASWFADASLKNIVTPDDTFIKFNYGSTGIFGWTGLVSVEINYSALNNIQLIASDADGRVNSKALYNKTGSVDFAEIETQLNDHGWLDNPTVAPTGSETPEDYAAFVALSYNRMYELKTITKASGQDDDISYKAILYKDGANGLTGNEIIEWYLPSSVEAQSLVETGTGEEDTAISPLNGTYWSSTAGSDEDAYSHSYSFKDNTFVSINESAGRMTGYKVRAVRKKP